MCFAAVPIPKREARIPLPGFCQAEEYKATKTWAKILHLGGARNKFSSCFVSFSLPLHFSASFYLIQPPCVEVPCLEAFCASRNPAARRSEDIIRAARLSALQLPCRFTPQSLALHQTKPGCL